MPVIGDAFIAVRPESTGFGRQVTSDVKKATSEAGKAGGLNLGQQVKGFFSKEFSGPAIAGAIGGAVTGSILLAAPQVLSAIKNFVGSSVAAFDEAEKANIRLQNTLLNTPRAASTSIGAFRDQAAALQDLTGFQDESIISGQAVLAQFQLTGQQIKQLTPLLLDYAARTGTDVPAAAKQLGRGLLGSGRALKAVGINFKDAGSIAANFDQIVSGLRRSVGGFAEKEAKTLAGQIKILHANIDDLQESIGSLAVPALTGLVKIGTGLTESLNQVIHPTKELGFWQRQLVGVIHTTLPGFTSLIDKLEGMGDGNRKASERIDETVNRLGALTAQLQRGDLTGAQYTAGVRALADEVQRAGGTQQQVDQIIAAGAGVRRQYRDQILGVADAHAEATAEARKQLLAELALVGGFVGIEASAVSLKNAQEGLTAAQRKVTHLQKEGKTGTDAYRKAQSELTKAVDDVATSGVSLTKTVADYIKQQKEAGRSDKEVIAGTKELLSSYGLTDKQIAGLIDRTGKYVSTQRGVLRRLSTAFEVPGLVEANTKLERYLRNLRDIPPDKRTLVTMTTRHLESGRAGPNAGGRGPAPPPAPSGGGQPSGGGAPRHGGQVQAALPLVGHLTVDLSTGEGLLDGALLGPEPA